MKRARRILWNVATAGSPVACAAVVALWVRSYRWEDGARRGIVYDGEGRRRWSLRWDDPITRGTAIYWDVRSVAGRLHVERAARVAVAEGTSIEPSPEDELELRWTQRKRGRDDRDEVDHDWMADNVRRDGGWLWAGIGGSHVVEDASGDGKFSAYYSRWNVVVPYRALAAVLAVLPGVATARWAGRLRRRRRQRRRLVAGLCPDCGYDCRATPKHCPECGWTYVG